MSGISCSSEMKRLLLFITVALLALPPPACRAQSGSDRERILELIGRIEEAYRILQSYECDIEGVYFDSGRESERYVIRFYFRKPNLFRVEFRMPYPEMTIFYTDGKKEFIARPLSAFPSLQFRFSVDNPLFKTPSGQGVNQMHLFHFLEFLRQNAGPLPQEGADFRSDDRFLSFWISAKDYVTGRLPERYGGHPTGIHILQKLSGQPESRRGVFRSRLPGAVFNSRRRACQAVIALYP